jgi:hypothetical protein
MSPSHEQKSEGWIFFMIIVTVSQRPLLLELACAAIHYKLFPGADGIYH